MSKKYYITSTVECIVAIEVTEEEYNSFGRKCPMLPDPITREEKGILEKLLEEKQPKPVHISYSAINNFYLEEEETK